MKSFKLRFPTHASSVHEVLGPLSSTVNVHQYEYILRGRLYYTNARWTRSFLNSCQIGMPRTDLPAEAAKNDQGERWLFRQSDLLAATECQHGPGLAPALALATTLPMQFPLGHCCSLLSCSHIPRLPLSEAASSLLCFYPQTSASLTGHRTWCSSSMVFG